MKINYYDLQTTCFYIRQDQCFGRVYIKMNPELNIEASGDFKEKVNEVLGQDRSYYKDDHTLCWSNVYVQDVIKLINTIYEIGGSEIRQQGMPVGISLLFKEIRRISKQESKHTLKLVD